MTVEQFNKASDLSKQMTIVQHHLDNLKHDAQIINFGSGTITSDSVIIDLVRKLVRQELEAKMRLLESEFEKI